MEYRQLGKSDLKVPVVSFGAWAIGGWMWGGTDDQAAVRALKAAVDSGITCIDTAAVYGMGHSEKIVGRALSGQRDRVVLATKCGLRWDLPDTGDKQGMETETPEGKKVKVVHCLKADSVRYEAEQSLERLQTDYIDLYQCHWPDPDTPVEETMGALNELKQEGKIRAIGVSNFPPDLIRESLEYAEIASDQPPFSLLRRDIEQDVLPFCREKGIGVLAYSPLAQGLLTGKVTMDREFPEGDIRNRRPWFTPENRRRILDVLERVKPIAANHNATLAQVAIAWVVAQEGLTTALVGARNEKQAIENAEAGDVNLTPEEIAMIRSLFEGLGEAV